LSAARSVEEAVEGLRAAFALGPEEAARQAERALRFYRDYRAHQRRLNHGDPRELAGLIGRFRSAGPQPPPDRGTLLLTLHYGPFPLLWLWLKNAQARGALPPFTLLYDATQYTPDVPEAQYRRLAAAGVVPPTRRDLDLAALGVRGALREATRRLREAEIVLMFPDAFAVPTDERALVCRVGRLEVAYPRGAAWLAAAAGAPAQGVAIRPTGEGHTVHWATPRASAAEALQELLDASVARDPAPWLAWFDAP